MNDMSSNRAAKPSVVIAALYKFAAVDDPQALRERLHSTCTSLGVRGTLLVAYEGLNGTVAGSRDAIDTLLTEIRSVPGFHDLEHKEAPSDTVPFRRLRVRVRPEIVTIGRPDVSPVATVGTYVEPEDWNDLITDPDVLLIDARNAYEVRIGTFEGAVDPQTESFGELPEWMDARIAAYREAHGKEPKVAMFCTGGIRCEKASSYLTAQGLDQIYHLKGGILKYLEDVPETDSTWQGECFVFDDRVAVTHGLQVGTHVQCYGCGEPVSIDEQQRPEFEAGVSCHRCYRSLTPEKRASLLERQAALQARDR